MFFSRKKNVDYRENSVGNREDAVNISEKVIVECPSQEDSVRGGDNIMCPPHEDINLGTSLGTNLDTSLSVDNAAHAAHDEKASYRITNFLETRKYLQQVKGCRERLELLGTRKSYHWVTNQETESLEKLIEEAQQRQLEFSAEIADEISKLEDVKQEMVLTLRYIEGLTWEEISDEMDLSVRTVQKLHGRGLPGMEKILLADGKIDADKVYNQYGYHGGGCHKYGYHKYSCQNGECANRGECGSYHCGERTISVD